MSYGRYFNELRAGESFRHWPGRSINEYDDTLLSLRRKIVVPASPAGETECQR